MFLLIRGERSHKQATPETVNLIVQSTLEHLGNDIDARTVEIAHHAARIAAEVSLELRDVVPLEDASVNQPTIFEGVTQ